MVLCGACSCRWPERSIDRRRRGAGAGHQRRLDREQADRADRRPGFRTLTTGPGEGYVVREDGLGTAQSGRQGSRESLLYFGQLSDFQLADEESPARVEFLDFGPFSAAWRPWEALNPQIDEAMIRQINAFADKSPIAAGNGSRAAMALTINTGDAADSQQLNETQWVRTLTEGGPLNPGSGVNPATSGNVACAALTSAIADTGTRSATPAIQDFDDYFEGPAPQFYDPNMPAGAFAGWPKYPSLMNRAQQPFTATGLDVPSYISFGNHDALVQGNAAANAAYEAVATGCIKPMSPVSPTRARCRRRSARSTRRTCSRRCDATRQRRAGAARPEAPVRLQEAVQGGLRERHPGRRPRLRLRRPRREDRLERAAPATTRGARSRASGSSRSTPSPRPGVIGPSADGNIDDPQFQWLAGELTAADAADELVVLFSHHAIPSLTADVPDELAPPCLIADAHGHDINPGCDLDPRNSAPIHLGADIEALLHQHPSVIAWVAGHSHVNGVEPYPSAERRRRLLEHPGRCRGRLAAAEPPARDIRQPGRHAVDLRHDPRPR